MADVLKVDTNELSQLARDIDRCYRNIYSNYKRDISSIRREVEHLIAKYSDYGSVVSSGRSILSSLRNIESKTESMESQSQRLVTNTKQAVNLYKQSESSAQGLINKESVRISGKVQAKEKISLSSTSIESQLSSGTKGMMTKLFNDIAVKLQGEKKFKIPFGPTVTFYSEVYSDYSTVTIDSGIDSEGNIQAPSANIFPSTDIGKGQADIDGEGKVKSSIGISDEQGKTFWIDEQGKTTYSYRNKTDLWATSTSAYVFPMKNKVGVGYAIDTRGNNYEGGPWSKVGVKLDWEAKEPTPTAVVTVEEPETESFWDKAWDGVVAAKDWVVDSAVNIYEGAKEVCSDIADWVCDNKEIIIGTIITVGVIIVAIALAPQTGGLSLGIIAF